MLEQLELYLPAAGDVRAVFGGSEAVYGGEIREAGDSRAGYDRGAPIDLREASISAPSSNLSDHVAVIET